MPPGVYQKYGQMGFVLAALVRDQLLAACTRASQAILAIYDTDFAVDHKADESPLTKADLASNEALVAALPAMEDLPIVSEENQERGHHDRYWLIDPLDGTKEFVKRNDEFTVNVALIENGLPIAGMVQLPVTGATYYGGDQGAWRKAADGDWQPIHAAEATDPIAAVVSKSHRGDAVDTFLRNLQADGHTVTDVSYGSSLKLCKVAEGSAHVYPRLGPTMPWDTAAAHAVCIAAGAAVTDMAGTPLRYDDPGRLNPWFIVGGPGLDWSQYANGIQETAPGPR